MRNDKISIESWRRSAEDLAEFVNRIWEHSYAGKMPFPHWTAEYLRWQLRMEGRPESRNLLAAYEGTNPVGVLLGTDYVFRSPAGIHPGSQWSWLSVCPEHRGRGIVKALDRERVHRQEAAGARLIVSYRYVGSRHSLAERPDRICPSQKFHRKVSSSVRVLDPTRFRKWCSNRIQGLLAQLAAPTSWIRLPRTSDSGIRDFSMGDLEACVELLNASFSSCVLAIHWNNETLRHQLCGSSLSQTLILEDKGRISGLVNFHALPYQDRTVENIGLFDLIAFGNIPTDSKVRLINAALTRMMEHGIILAVKLRCGDTAAWPMARARFIPQPAQSFLVLQRIGDPVHIPSDARMHLLWR